MHTRLAPCPRWLALALALAGCPEPQPASDATAASDVPWSHPDVAPDRVDDGLLHVVVTDAMRGEGIPCKVTVRRTDGGPDPSWGVRGPGGEPAEQVGEWLDAPNLALGIGRWVLMARGRADLALPPGDYALTVTRGGEYAALEFTARLAPGLGATVSGALRRVVNTEGEIAGEFHVHSAPSFDSDVPLDQRVLSLAVEGVEVFASTDHDAVGDFAPEVRALGLERHIHWVRGDEITADGVGHFNVYPLPEGVDPATQLAHDGLNVSQIVARARAVAPAAVLQLNHPLWNESIGYWRFAGLDPATGTSAMELVTMFDAVEVWNGHTLDQGFAEYVDPDGVIDAWMSTLQNGARATAMGNTDTHRLSRTPPGWPRTYLRVANDDPAMVTDAMVLDAIRAHDTSVSSGPFLRASVEGARPGATARAGAGGRVTVRVELQTLEWAPADQVEVIANRRTVATLPVTAAPADGARRQQWDVPLTLTRDAWVVVRTRAAGTLPAMAGEPLRPMPSIALVNPVYVDVDGDGRYTPPGAGNGP